MLAERHNDRESAENGQLLIAALLSRNLLPLVFTLLPVNSRLVCRGVCRSWRACLDDSRNVWEVCDLSESSGVEPAFRTPELLLAASACARGELRELNLTGWLPDDGAPHSLMSCSLFFAVRSVLRSNADTLHTVRAWKCGVLTDDMVRELATECPRLGVLQCNVSLQANERAYVLDNAELVSPEEEEWLRHERDPSLASRIFFAREFYPLESEADQYDPQPHLSLTEPHFAPVRIQNLSIDLYEAPLFDFPALVTLAAQHSCLESLRVCGGVFMLPAQRLVAEHLPWLQRLCLVECQFCPGSLPFFTTMISHSLTELDVHGNDFEVADAALTGFCAAIRASRLVRLALHGVRLWSSDFVAVISACTGLPTLQSLSLTVCYGMERIADPAIGAALFALVAANSALETLRLYENGRDVPSSATACGPLFAAVADNTRLRSLTCYFYMDEQCARDVVLPAIRKNTSLLELSYSDSRIPSLAMAREIVEGRRRRLVGAAGSAGAA